MKKFSLMSFLPFFALVFCFVLVGCENFMDSADIRKEVEDAIAYNNAASCNVIFRTDIEKGEFLGSTDRLVKVGYSTEIDFELKKDDYVFVKLEAVSQTDKTASRESCVELTLTKKDEAKGIYSYKIKLLKDASDILIRPVCLEYPKVESVSPSDAQLNPANTQITVKFNVPMEASVIQKIKITSKEEDKSSLFETPVLDSTKRILTITPKASELMDFIGTSGGVTISVSLPASITVTQNDIVLSLKQNENTSFEVKYKAITDNNAPVYIPDTFFATRPQIEQTTTIAEEEKFNEDILLMNDEYDELYGPDNYWPYYSAAFFDEQDKIIQNRMGKFVYLYGQFTDTDSGIRKITVYENYHGNNPTKYQENAPVTTDYYNNSSGVITFNTNSNGVTTFCINHELKSDDGAISLQVAAVDICGNSTLSPVVIGFKRTNTVFELRENFQLHNDIVGFNYTNYSEELLSKKLRTLTLSAYYEDSNGDPCGDSIYNAFPLPASINTISCKYINSKDILTTDKFQKVYEDDENDWTWNLELDVEHVNGLAMEIIIEDDTGNRIVKEYTIPSLDHFSYIEEYQYYSEDYYENHVQFFYTKGEETCNPCFQRYDSEGNKTINEYDDYYGLSDEYRYHPLPCYLVERVNSYPYVYFYSESPSGVELKKEDVLVEKQEFEMENFEGKDKPYLIANSSTQDRTNISIKIPKLLWEKGCDSGYVLLKSKGILPPKDGETEPQIGNKYYLFDKDTDKFTFEVRTQDLFASETEIVLCGTVNNLARYEKEYTIPKLDKTADKTLDNKLPEYTKERISPEDYSITILDTESGPNVGNFYERAEIYEDYGADATAASALFSDYLSNHGIKYTADSSHSFKVDIPAWFFEEGLSYYISDKQGNLYCGNIQKTTTPIHWDVSKLQKNSNSAGYSLSVTCRKIKSNSGENRDYIYVYKYKKVGTAGEWVLINGDEKELSKSYSNTASVLLSSDKFNTEELSGGDYFIKIITSRNQQIDFWHYEERDFSAPFIAYLDCPAFDAGASDNAYDSNYDLILPNGGSQESVAISSRSPVFVQTAVTWRPYEECKNWSADMWITNHRIIGEKQFDLDDTSSLQRYAIPVSKIQDGQCYCVIAHFADGHTEKSQVMQK